jgi:hypothetical protein
MRVGASESIAVDVEDGTASTGRLVWGDESKITIYEAMRRSAESPDEKSATVEAAEWLEDYLALNQGRAASAIIKINGASAGHSYDSLKRARRLIGSAVESSGFPRRTIWLHPRKAANSRSSVRASLRGDSLTALTALTVLISAVGAVGAVPRACSH